MTDPGLLFRNVDVSPDDAVETWPVEAISTALERGSLRHWARIAAAVYNDPWGPVSRSLEEALTCVEPYGVAPGMRRVVEQGRARREHEEKQEVAAELRTLLARSGLSAAEFAGRLGTSASRLSTYLNAKVTPNAGLMVRARRVTASH
jgi:hypothetical protein